jgi:two-component system nitrate/nitrite response regulator NarL
MLLIATQDVVLAKFWSEALSPEFSLYEPFVKDCKNLEVILKKNPIDILILDQNILPPEGINHLSVLVGYQKNTKIVLLVEQYHPQEELSAVIFGAKAYCLKNTSAEILKKIIKKIAEGELWVDRKFVSRLLSSLEELTKAKHNEAVHLDSGFDSLTPREKEIANLVASGYPNRKIANTLNISERTVKAHLGVIFRKLSITDRLQLALYITKYQQVSGIWRAKPPG